MKVIHKLTNKEKAELQKGVIEVSARAMNRTALGIVDAVFTLFPDIKFNELKEILPDTINPSAPVVYKSLFKPYTDRNYGVVQPASIVRECENQNLDVNASHFMLPEETFTTSDGIKVLVSRSWESKDTETGENNLQNLINHVEQYGIRVVEFEKHKGFTKGRYHLEVINPPLVSKLESKQKQKPKMYIWLILLLMIIIGLYFVYIFNIRTSEFSDKLNQEAVHIANAELTREISSENSVFDQIKSKIQSEEKIDGVSIDVHHLGFILNKAELIPGFESLLNEVVEILDKNSDITLTLVGHTCSDGDSEFNTQLSLLRANTVKQYLIDKKIDENRITALGSGSSRPTVPNTNEVNKQKNRRVEFIFNKI